VTTWDIDPGSLRLPLIIAPRGDVKNAPENTIPAFQRALAAGADGIELDVRLTRDRQLVVFHDRHLDRTSNGHGPLKHRTFGEIRALDVGAWFSPAFRGEMAPTLDEVFEALPHDYLLNVEMKVVMKGMRLIAHRVAETVRRHRRWDSTLVASFNPVALYHLRRMEPRIARGYIWSKKHPYPIRSRWLSPLVQAHWYDPADETYDLQAQRKFQRRGGRVLAWDVDFGRDLEKMASVHLDAVVTDDLAEMVGRKRDLARRLA
jgi:glycerophosphoryl diester phosphodiesterase